MENMQLPHLISTQQLVGDLRNELPRIAKMIGETADNVAVFDNDYWPNEYMMGDFRDRVVHMDGVVEGLPMIQRRRSQRNAMVGIGVTVYQNRLAKDIKYAIAALKGQYDDECFLVVAKNNVFRLKRNCVRLNKEAGKITQIPILPDGVLDNFVQNTVGFLRRAKDIEKFGVKIKRGIVLDGPPGNGKAQPMSATVMTPRGPIKMREVKIGLTVCTPSGVSKVVGVFPQGEVDIYRVNFSDGSFAECCKEHLWKVEAQCGSKGGVFTTEYLSSRLKAKDGKRLYSIPMTEPVEFDRRQHVINPYLLGSLLGDGSFSQSNVLFSSMDQQIIDQVTAVLPDGYRLKQPKSGRPCDYLVTRPKTAMGPSVLTDELKRLGLMGLRSESKFIPDDYLHDCVENRVKLLQGLMDTDGFAHKDGVGVSYCTTSKVLSDGVRFLVESLGGKCTISEMDKTYTHNGEKKQGKTAYHCQISLRGEMLPKVFTLERKKSRVKIRSKYNPKRMIDKIEFVRKEEAQCILLDSEPHLYLTDNFVVTHNTMLCRYIQKLCSQHGISWDVITSADIDAAYADKNLNELFQKHAVTFFDDIDVEYMDRKRGNGKMACSLLTAMDGMSDKGHLIRIFTTNEEVSELDPAFIRPGRIDTRITLEPPNRTLRRKLVDTVWPEEIRQNIDMSKLIEQTEKFSFADMELIRTFLVTNKTIGDGKWNLTKAFEDFNSRKFDKKKSKFVGFQSS